MSVLDKTREWFKSYNGPTVEVKTKHATFVSFDKDEESSLSNLVQYQAYISEISVTKKAVKEIASAVEEASPDLTGALVQSLQRRFVDDHRNQENREATYTPGVPRQFVSAIEEAIQSGDLERLQTLQGGMEGFDLTETKEYTQVVETIESLS